MTYGQYLSQRNAQSLELRILSIRHQRNPPHHEDLCLILFRGRVIYASTTADRRANFIRRAPHRRLRHRQCPFLQDDTPVIWQSLRSHLGKLDSLGPNWLRPVGATSQPIRMSQLDQFVLLDVTHFSHSGSGSKRHRTWLHMRGSLWKASLRSRVQPMWRSPFVPK